MSKNLVELMAIKLAKPCWEWDKCCEQNKRSYRKDAERALSVVKEHIGDIAVPCGCCANGRILKDCKTCKGTGVIARTDGGGK
jgi:hypothetical protein